MNTDEHRLPFSLSLFGSISVLSDKETVVLVSGGSSFRGIACGARADLEDYFNPVS